MSELLVTSIYNQEGEGAPNFPKGATVTGVITATSFSGSGANLTGIDATALKDSNGTVRVQANTTGAVITGNVSVGGTLTYEDVTNVDAVGVITARSGIDITGASAGVNGSSNLILKTGGTEKLRIESSGATRLKNEYLRFQAANQTVSDFSQKVGLKWTYETDIEIAKIEISRPSWSGGPSDMLFHTTNTSGTVSERLRIGKDGQIGLSGANYGTSGQVLTSAGSGSAVQWATPSGSNYGLVVDEWLCRGASAVAEAARPTTSTYLNGSGWTGNDGKMYRLALHIGSTGVTFTNEVISFPSTGTWKIEWSGYATNCSQEIMFQFYTTADNSSYGAEKRVTKLQETNNSREIPFYMYYFFDVTDISNYKMKVRAYGNNSSNATFAAGDNATDGRRNSLLFTKVA